MTSGDRALVEYTLALADDLLILGHRNSEWCGHGPTLEEDIALGNIALDCIGQAAQLLDIASSFDNCKRSADKLAFFRDSSQFFNCHLVEQPNGDFAQTMVRQFFFDAYLIALLENLQSSSNKPLAEFATKAIKETRYHLRHCSEWVIRLGDGTTESASRTQAAVNQLWRFTEELFTPSPVELSLLPTGMSVDCSMLKTSWQQTIDRVFSRANLVLPPPEQYAAASGRSGFHTEQLSNLLAVMQSTARAFPNAEW